MTHSKLKFAISTLLHLSGIFVLFAVFSGLFISQSTASIIYGVLGDDQITEQILTPLVIIFGLSTVVWGVGVFAARRLNRPQLKTLKRAHGTIMTETLIVLPVFFLLTSGLAQIGINSMAGLLTTVGAYEAGRTMAAWGPEVGNKRISESITRAEVTERARLAVAVIVAPVAQTTLLSINRCSTSPTLTKFLNGMVGAGVLPTPNAGARLNIWDYQESFGDKSFAQRGPAKLKSAYCSVGVEASSFNNIPTDGEKGGDFEVSVTYRHRAVFPMVRKIFANSVIKRSYKMRSHIPPNDCLPESPKFFDFTRPCT